ncbi:unnamed protein product [Tilletia controversa]|nr:hypothetical protein CF328_g8761 [Tilletia controversa]CAD6909022.1 unnamed protein product [Tilletia controversa]CAD6927236.1 unnamed protein product [Tilletia controversa]CAD6968526.1 unnamed protein product [Tilletia controversa]
MSSPLKRKASGEPEAQPGTAKPEQPSLKINLRLPKHARRGNQATTATDKENQSLNTLIRDHCDASVSAKKSPTTPRCYETKLLFFQSGNPNAKVVAERKLRQVTAEEHLFKVFANNTLWTFMERLERKAKPIIGGLPINWKISAQAESSTAVYFKNLTLIDIHADDEEGEESFSCFLDELGESNFGRIHITLKSDILPPGDVGKAKGAKTESNQVWVSGKLKSTAKEKNESDPSLPPGIHNWLKQLMAKYICRDTSCPWKIDGDKFCWLPYWKPSTHLQLGFSSLKVWAAALDKNEPNVKLHIPPKIHPFLPPSSATAPATNASSSSARGDDAPARVKPVVQSEFIYDEDDDSDFEILGAIRGTEVLRKTQVKTEPGTSTSAASVAVKSEPQPKSVPASAPLAAPEEKPKKPFYHDDPTLPKYGPKIDLDEFGRMYGVAEETIKTLKDHFYRIPHAVVAMNQEEVEHAQFGVGEQRALRTAARLWRDDGDPRVGGNAVQSNQEHRALQQLAEAAAVVNQERPVRSRRFRHRRLTTCASMDWAHCHYPHRSFSISYHI